MIQGSDIASLASLVAASAANHKQQQQQQQQSLDPSTNSDADSDDSDDGSNSDPPTPPQQRAVQPPSVPGSAAAADSSSSASDVESSPPAVTFTAQDESEFFYALRANNTELLTSLLGLHPSLIDAEFGVYEGFDSKGMMPQVKSKRIYTYTADCDKGYCYPLHVASEGGHKDLVLMLHGLSPEQADMEDYRNHVPEEIANGRAKEAFLEIKGLRKEVKERYEGETNARGQPHGKGLLYKKMEGYEEKEHVLYEGTWNNGQMHGKGMINFGGADNRRYEGNFSKGLFDGHGVLFADPLTLESKSKKEKKVYIGLFKDGLKHGSGVEYDPEDNRKLYQGGFKADRRAGYATAWLAAGHKYEGNFDDGKMHGAGTYTLPNGERYEGLFVDDVRCGDGSFYKSDGSRIDGVWDDGSMVEERKVPKKFVADPMDLFGSTDPDFDFNLSSSNGGDASTLLFDRDGSADAAVVRVALSFLDGVSDALARKRVDGCRAPAGAEAAGALTLLCEEAKRLVVKRAKDEARREARKTIMQEEEEEEGYGDGKVAEGDIARALVQSVLEYGQMHNDALSTSLANSLARARLMRSNEAIN